MHSSVTRGIIYRDVKGTISHKTGMKYAGNQEILESKTRRRFCRNKGEKLP
jgi:hypothetical protein